MGADDGKIQVPKHVRAVNHTRTIDELAVLDGQLQVRGVTSLRVVDASSWHDDIGMFPTTVTYMVSLVAFEFLLIDQ
jgi:hypothetical protein